MLLTWGDWLRFVVTPLVIAGFTAIVAARNARKTPHERLKNLVDIHANMPTNLDIRNVVQKAIARELVDFDRRLAADQRGFWAGVRERVAQRGGVQIVTIVLLTGVLAAVTTSLVNPDMWSKTVTLVIICVSVAVILIAGRIVLKGERRQLNRERAAVEITSQFSRAQLHSLLINECVDCSRGDYHFKVAEKLADMGVFDRGYPVGSAEQPDLQVYRFDLTQFGKEAVAEALLERRPRGDRPARSGGHRDLNRAELADGNGEGDDNPGRGAPGGVAPG